MTDLKIIEMKTAELVPYLNNPRKNDKAVDPVAESIKEFGFKVPIIVDKQKVIVAGHTRLRAAKKLGLETVPVVIADDLTDDQIKAFRLADNKTAEFSEWDHDLLIHELLELQTADFEMLPFGFDEVEESTSETELEEDDFEAELPEEPKAKRGDIYKLGRHRLMCGDSTDSDDIDKLMNGEKAELLFTDPPYNIASDSKNYAADVSKKMGDLSKSDWDFCFDIKKMLNVLPRALSENCSLYICTSHFLAGEIWEWMRTWSDHYSYCVWSKPNPMPSLSKRHWTWNTELICYATKGKHIFNFPSSGHALSTWTINKKNGETAHPTEKPVAVPGMAISHSSKEGGAVLDLFGGSGSTLIACEELKRNCYMMELDPRWVDVIIGRWEKLTGEKAELISE